MGNQKWSQPGYTPQIATFNNGVVAQSGTGPYVSFDQLGNVIGQMPCTNPTVSWTNNVYQMAPVIQVSCGTPPTPAAPPNANFQQSNPSQNSASAICGNESDQLVMEYKPNPAYGAIFTPVCTEFTFASSFSAPASNLNFYELNVSDQPGHNTLTQGDYPNYAIFRRSLLLGLQNIQQIYGHPLLIESGYRSPKVQQIIDNTNIANGLYSTPSPDSRHIHGDAADIGAGTQKSWDALSGAAEETVGSCIEPERDTGDGHVHVDWRGECPTKWSE